MIFKWYDWQEKIIHHKGDITIRGGRQSGKSWGVAKQIKDRAKMYPGSRHLIIAAAGRQSNYLLEKVKQLIGEAKKNYRARATLTRLPLKNGTDIYRYDVGITGVYVEGLSSVDFLYVDEAIHVGHKVFDSIIPMLAEPKQRGLGWITLLSSTRGRPKGYFFESFKRKNFEKLQIKAEDCPHIDKKFLEEERERLGKRMYDVIYNGEFDEYADKYFSPEIIDRAVRIAFWSHRNDYKPLLRHYLGIDPARKGKSKAAFAEGEMSDKMRIVHAEEHEKTSLMELEKITEKLQELFKNKKIFIDDGGFGAGLVDLMEEKFKNKLFPINNKERGIEFKIIKEDLYSNLQRMMEKEEVEFVNQKEIIEGLKKVEWDDLNQKIIGTDMSEAIVRVCWAWRMKPKKIKMLRF